MEAPNPRRRSVNRLEFDVNFPNPNPSFCSTPIQKIVAALSAPLTGENSAVYYRLIEAAPPPTDHLGLQLAIAGAAKATTVASQCIAETLKGDTEDLDKFILQFQDLHLQCQELFSEHAVVDPVTLVRRRLSATPAWRLLALVGSQGNAGTGFSAAAGILLIRSLIVGKPMPTGLCKALCTSELEFHAELLSWELLQPAEEIENPTIRRLAGNYKELLTLLNRSEFQVHPRDIHQIARDSWTCRAAYASVHSRSAILDSRCLSSSQMEELKQSKTADVFDSYPVRRAAIYFAAFTGLAPAHLRAIPFAPTVDPGTEDCNIWIDVEQGLLIKNYQILCKDVSKFTTGNSESAGYTFSQPLPSCVHATLNELLNSSAEAKTLGDLVPELSEISNRQTLYPSTAGFAPSWAKLRFGVAPYLRQNGMDSLLAAVFTADFAATLKSKLYYCRITPAEVVTAANQAYHLLGFEPCISPKLEASFGTDALSTDADLRQVYERLAAQTVAATPSNNSTVEKLLAHHNHLTHLVGFQISLASALRESKVLPITSGHAACVRTFAVDEKTPADIEGQLEALVPPSMYALLQEYKMHCCELAARLHKKHLITQFTKCLWDIQNTDCAPLLVLAAPSGSAKLLSTSDILRTATPTLLAPDFGRKWAENALRKAGMRSTDIDRVLRHEGRGQESMSSASDGCFRSWTRRAGAILDRALSAVMNTNSSTEGSTQ